VTVKVADAREQVERLVLVVKMATVVEECITEEKHSVVRFLLAEGINAKVIQKKYFLFMLGNVCRVKRFHLGGKHFAD
jgi:hypothetical protein